MTEVGRLGALLAALQAVDVVGNAVVARSRLDAHHDHLGLPMSVRRALQPIKVVSSATLLLGVGRPRLRAGTSAGLVVYYAAAARYHLLAGDHPVVAAPAAGLGALAALVLLRSGEAEASKSC